MKTGSSYLSQSELPLTFGLGAAAVPARVEVRWPSGRVDVVDARADTTTTIREGETGAASPAGRPPSGAR